MNLYTDAKTERMPWFEIPTKMFQSLNAGFIILFCNWYGQNANQLEKKLLPI
jgi:POT family proton-dependent oligopeptide transporter